MSQDRSSEDPRARELPLIQAAEQQEFGSDDDHEQKLTGVTGSSDSVPGSRRSIGGYRTVRKLGEGGMGVVYEAEQKHPKRRVALKVVSGGRFVDEHRVKLFEREVQTLARLKHSHIASIYESGCTEDGEHFFAMELVRGVPLMQFARSRQLGVRARLELFCQICLAINYAHQRGVIHRDLKPSNIIVDAEGSPKILDFGLAKITDADVAVTTMVTELGRIQGTLPYMSPEQARGNRDEIDLRSDVYSLGVIFYELLTEELPYEVAPSSGLPEAVRVICEEAPRKPSTISKTLRGDVETISLKALEKEPSRRYQSASAFAEDVQRYLTNQPILARPPSAMYHLKKLVTRHKVPFGLLATLCLLTVSFAIWMTVLYGQAVDARDEAELVTQALADMLAAVDPAKEGKDTTLRQMLDQAAETVGETFKDNPLVEARLRTTIGQAYWALDKSTLKHPAMPHLERALEIRRQLRGEEHEDTLRSVNDLARVLRREGAGRQGRNLKRAGPLLERALETAKRELGEDHPVTLTSMHQLADVYYSDERIEEAEPLFLQVLAARRRVLGAEHPDTLIALVDLGGMYAYTKRFDEAEPMIVHALEAGERVWGKQHPRMIELMYRLSRLYGYQKRYEEAVPLLEEIVEISKQIYVKPTSRYVESLLFTYQLLERYDEAETLLKEYVKAHEPLQKGDWHSMRFMLYLAQMYRDRGRFEEAEETYLHMIEIAPHVFNRADEIASFELGNMYRDQGRFDDAEKLWLSARKIFEERGHGLDNRQVAGAVVYPLADMYSALGRFEEAETLYKEVLDTSRRELGEEHETTLFAMNVLGLYYRVCCYDQAEPQFLKTIEACERVLGEEHRLTLLVKSNLGQLYNIMQCYEEAESVHAEVVSVARQALPISRERRIGEYLMRLGVSLTGLERFDEAEAALLEANEILTRRAREGMLVRLQCASSLGALYTKMRRYDEAEPLLAQAVAGVRRRPVELYNTALFLKRHGVCLTKLQRYDGAESTLLEAQEIMERMFGAEHHHTGEVISALADLYDDWSALEPGKGYADQAAEWRAKLPNADPAAATP